MSRNKTENIVEYRKKYYEEHKKDYKQTEICEICNGKFQLWNKSQHNRTQKHKKSLETKKIKEEQIRLQQELDEIKTKLKNLI